MLVLVNVPTWGVEFWQYPNSPVDGVVDHMSNLISSVDVFGTPCTIQTVGKVKHVTIETI